MAKRLSTNLFKALSSNLELLLLYLPLLFLIFPQQPAYFHAQAIFWLFPLLYFFILISKKRKAGKNFLIFSLLFSSFLLSSFLSSFSSASAGMSAIQIAQYIAVFLYSIYFYLIVDTKAKLKFFSNLLLATAVLLVSLSFYFHFLVSSPKLGGINLFYPTHGHNHIAAFLLLILPLSIINCLNAKKKSHLIAHCFLLIVFSLQLFLSFSRSAYLIFPLTIFLLIRHLRPRLKPLLTLLVAALIPVGLLIAVIGASHTSLSQDLSSTTIKQNWLLRQTIKPFNTENRLNYWSQAIASFKNRPLFGYGPGTFRLASLRYRQTIGSFSFYAHNSLLQVLSDQGFLGLLTFSLLILFIFSKLFKLPRPFLPGSVISSFLHPELVEGSRNPALPAGRSTTGPLKPYSSRTLYSILNTLYFPFSLGLLALFLLSLLDFSFDFLLIFTLFFSTAAILLRQTEKSYRPLKLLPKTLLFSFSLLLFTFAILYTTAHSIVLYTNSTPTPPKEKLHRLKLATTIFPFDPDLTKKYLSQLSLTPNPQALPTAQDLITTWHAQNPSLLSQLAQLQSSNQDSSSPEKVYKLSLSLDQNNPANYQRLFDFYQSSNQTSKAKSLITTILNSRRHNFTDADNPEITKLFTNQPTSLIDLNSSPEIDKLIAKYQFSHDSRESLLLSKLFYLSALEHFKQNNTKLAQAQLKLASLLSPQWSYFHIELANLNLTLEQPSLTQETLIYCQQFHYAQPACSESLADIVKLSDERVGFLKTDILNSTP